MLRELHELSENFELSWVGYDTSTAIWEVDLSFPIPVVSLLETTSRSGKGKSNASTSLSVSPERSRGAKPGEKRVLPSLRRNAEEPLLIDDAAEYVFGVGSRGKKRQPLYLELLRQCIQETEDEGAKRVLAYVESCDIEALDRDLNQKLPPPTDKQGNPSGIAL